MLTTVMSMISIEAKLLPDELAAFNALKAFLASKSGQDIEQAILTLFAHTPPSQGSAVVVEPRVGIPVNQSTKRPTGIV